MDGLTAIVLAAILGGTPIALEPRTIALEPRTWIAPGPHLEVEWSSLALSDQGSAPRIEDRIAAIVAETVDLSAGWIGLAVSDDVSLLLDVRVDAVPTSPDPARPDAESGLAARVGISVRPAIEIRL